MTRVSWTRGLLAWWASLRSRVKRMTRILDLDLIPILLEKSQRRNLLTMTSQNRNYGFSTAKQILEMTPRDQRMRSANTFWKDLSISMRLTTSLSQTSNWLFRNIVSLELRSVDKASRLMISKSRGNSVLVHSYPNWQKEMTVKEIGPIQLKPIWVNSRHMAIIRRQITIPITNLISLNRMRSATSNMILKC